MGTWCMSIRESEALKRIWDKHKANSLVLMSSCGRAEGISSYDILHPFEPEHIILLVERDEREEYCRHNEARAQIVTLAERWAGLGNSRKEGLSYARHQGIRWVFIFDDDYESLSRRTEFLPDKGYWKLADLAPDEQWIAYAGLIATSLRHKAARVGLSYKQSNWHYRQHVKVVAKTTNLCVMDLLALDRLGVDYDVGLPHLDDWDITLNIIKSGGTTACWYGCALGMEKMASQVGGQQKSCFARHKDGYRRELATLQQKYGADVVQFTSRGHGFLEPKVNWQLLKRVRQ